MQEGCVVGLMKLATSVEVEAKALAADLGTTAYEERLKLTAGLPAIVLATTDDAAAHGLAAKLRGRGHRAHVLRRAAITPARAMVALRQFQLDPDGLTAHDALAWSDVSALIHARHHTRSESVDVVKEKKFDLGRAIASGGMILRKTEKREVVTARETTEHVLYIFRSDGHTPWILREQSANYSGLGVKLAPSAMQNFTTAVSLFRAHAIEARFDDTLVRRSVPDVDLFAHLIATAP